MSKLEELRREEDKARLEFEKAEKEAQRIRMSIPDILDEKSREKENELKEFSRLEMVKIEEKTADLAKNLSSETEKELEELSRKMDILERAAEKHLKKRILTSGSEG